MTPRRHHRRAGVRPALDATAFARRVRAFENVWMADLEGLPGAELVGRGLGDLSWETLSAEALALSIASTRLRGLGIELPDEGALRCTERPGLA
jgi:hypothetical protein